MPGRGPESLRSLCLRVESGAGDTLTRDWYCLDRKESMSLMGEAQRDMGGLTW